MTLEPGADLPFQTRQAYHPSPPGPDNPDRNNFGATASYVDLMQRTFNAPDEKALLASVS